jgi:toxin CcdB
MAYLQVYPSLAPGWLLDVQSDLIAQLNVRVVIPLIPLPEAPLPAKRLNPIFEIDGKRCSLVTQYMASVPETTLRSPITDLSHARDEVTAALDFLLHGF